MAQNIKTNSRNLYPLSVTRGILVLMTTAFPMEAMDVYPTDTMAQDGRVVSMSSQLEAHCLSPAEIALALRGQPEQNLPKKEILVGFFKNLGLTNPETINCLVETVLEAQGKATKKTSSVLVSSLETHLKLIYKDNWPGLTDDQIADAAVEAHEKMSDAKKCVKYMQMAMQEAEQEATETEEEANGKRLLLDNLSELLKKSIFTPVSIIKSLKRTDYYGRLLTLENEGIKGFKKGLGEGLRQGLDLENALKKADEYHKVFQFCKNEDPLYPTGINLTRAPSELKSRIAEQFSNTEVQGTESEFDKFLRCIKEVLKQDKSLAPKDPQICESAEALQAYYDLLYTWITIQDPTFSDPRIQHVIELFDKSE